MTSQQGLFKSQLIEIAVFTRKDGRFQLVVKIGAPVFSRIIYITVGEPFGKI